MMCHHTSLAPESSKGVVTRAGVHDFGVNLRGGGAVSSGN